MIEIRDLSHSYGPLRALDRVSFTVRSGAIVGLVGPNGAGKTTLVRTIATLRRPTQGTVEVEGIDALAHPARVRAKVGYLPVRASPRPDLLCWEHLDLYARIAGHRGVGLKRRVDSGLDAAGLADRAQTPTPALSKGLRQRLALQATLMHDPVALVLDEPTDGLDPDSREALALQVRALAAKGVAVLLSNHVLQEVEELADEVVILSGGRVREALAPRPGLELRLRTRVSLSAEGLLALPGVVEAHPLEGGAWRLRMAAEVADGGALVAALVGAGEAVVELQPIVRSLRDRYRDAVEGGAR